MGSLDQKWSLAWVKAVGFAVALALRAGPTLAEAGGSIWTWDKLTGDWGGARGWLADHGVTSQLEMTGLYQGLFAGSGHSAFEPGGRVDALFNFDSGKLGLWEGGGLHTHLEYRFGDLPAFRGGALWPVNTGVVLPLGANEQVEATSIYVSQRFGDSTSILAGKINAVDLLSRDPFFGGWGIHRFMNLAFVAPPSGVFPPVVVGAILKYKYKPFDLTFMVYDPDDRTHEYGTDRLFSTGVNLSLGGAWSGKVADRPTSLALTGIYSTRDGADLSQVLLPANLKTNPKEGSFNVALQFGHLLLESKTQPGKGIGVYAKGSIADGNPNPIRASFVGGIAGHGIVPSRPLDSFGLGYYFYKFSDDLQDAVDAKIHFGDEQGFEAFYNLAATPWFRLTADLQAIDPANGASKKAVIAALRGNVAF